MRFMMLMIPKGYEKAEPGAVPTAKAVAAMMKYNEQLQKAGVLLALDGLHPPSHGGAGYVRRRQAKSDRRTVHRGQGSGGRVLDDPGEDRKRKRSNGRRAARLRTMKRSRFARCRRLSDFPADVQEAAAGFPELKSQSEQPGRA